MTFKDIALTLVPGLGARGAVKLLETFVTAERIFDASCEELIHFAELNPRIAEAVASRESFAQAQKEMEYCRKNGITPIASTDSEFPQLLLQSHDYPHVLYVMGNLAALNNRCISMVGTRRVSSYGERMCHEIVRDLGAKIPNLTIVSGLAFGVDGASHRAALACGIPTVAVVANPLPAVTPTQHSSLAAEIIEQGGAIVSECHSLTKYRSFLYISRNRIVAAMSSATILAESPIAGGSMVTAQLATDYHRALFAIPGRLSDKNSAGCNMLIGNNKAQIFISAERVIRELMWDSQDAADRGVIEPLHSEFTEKQMALLDCFKAEDPLNIEELSALTTLNVSELSVMLMELELMGVVRMLPGSRYELLNVVVSQR